MREWTYDKKLIYLLCENTVAYYRKNVTIVYANETVITDCMYLKDKDASKWVGIVYDGDKEEFVNFSLLEDDQVLSVLVKDLYYVGYTVDVMDILRGCGKHE